MGFSINDLFFLGLICDVLGAYYLASSFVRKTSSFAEDYYHMNRNDLVERGKEFIDNRIGISVLVTGFVIQAGAYLMELMGVRSILSGLKELLVALILGIILVFTIVCLRFALKPRMLLNFTKRIALSRPKFDREDMPLAKGLWYMMLGADLVGYAQALGYKPRNNAETQQNRRQFIKRIYKLDLPKEADLITWPPSSDNKDISQETW